MRTRSCDCRTGATFRRPPWSPTRQAARPARPVRTARRLPIRGPFRGPRTAVRSGVIPTPQAARERPGFRLPDMVRSPGPPGLQNAPTTPFFGLLLFRFPLAYLTKYNDTCTEHPGDPLAPLLPPRRHSHRRPLRHADPRWHHLLLLQSPTLRLPSRRRPAPRCSAPPSCTSFVPQARLLPLPPHRRSRRQTLPRARRRRLLRAAPRSTYRRRPPQAARLRKWRSRMPVRRTGARRGRTGTPAGLPWRVSVAARRASSRRRSRRRPRGAADAAVEGLLGAANRLFRLPAGFYGLIHVVSSPTANDPWKSTLRRSYQLGMDAKRIRSALRRQRNGERNHGATLLCVFVYAGLPHRCRRVPASEYFTQLPR